jgi:membrane protein required for colicin V production
MTLTILDGIVLAVVLLSAVLAMMRGFLREVLSIGSWVAAAAGAYFLYPSAAALCANSTSPRMCSRRRR